MERRCKAKVLYHGTTYDAHEKSLQRHNHYRNIYPGKNWSSGGGVENDVYLAENSVFPAILAMKKAKRYHAKPLLLIVSKSKIPNDIKPDVEAGEWWHTEYLPTGSYVTYDLQEDTLDILSKKNRKRANSLLEKLLKQ